MLRVHNVGAFWPTLSFLLNLWLYDFERRFCTEFLTMWKEEQFVIVFEGLSVLILLHLCKKGAGDEQG